MITRVKINRHPIFRYPLAHFISSDPIPVRDAFFFSLSGCNSIIIHHRQSLQLIYDYANDEKLVNNRPTFRSRSRWTRIFARILFTLYKKRNKNAPRILVERIGDLRERGKDRDYGRRRRRRNSRGCDLRQKWYF